MFERFNKPARLVVRNAVVEAELRDDPRIGSEHLLIALSVVDLSIDRSVLGPLDISAHDLRRVLGDLDSEALASVGVDIDAEPTGPTAAWPTRRRHRPFTHSARDTLEASLAEARRLRQRKITPEAILLGLLQSPDSDTAARMMSRLGVDRTATRNAVIHAMRKTA